MIHISLLVLFLDESFYNYLFFFFFKYRIVDVQNVLLPFSDAPH